MRQYLKFPMRKCVKNSKKYTTLPKNTLINFFFVQLQKSSKTQITKATKNNVCQVVYCF